MKSPTIIISGKQGSGKSTLARGLEKHFPRGFTKTIKFADPLYELHEKCLPILHKYGIRPKTMLKDGELLQILGTEYGRKKIDEYIWVAIALQRAVKFFGGCSGRGFVIIDDARFENEVKAFHNAFTIRLEASPEVRKLRCSYWREDQNHPSEIGLDDWARSGNFDLVIDTSKLTSRETLSQVLTALKKEFPHLVRG